MLLLIAAAIREHTHSLPSIQLMTGGEAEFFRLQKYKMSGLSNRND
jgi:hypothetical protein